MSEVATLTIERLGHRGHGIASFGGASLFVPGALPGEVVRAEVTPGSDRATLLAVETASPERVAPYCGFVGRCGGCTLQHLGATGTAEFKRNLLLEALRLARVEAEVGPTLDAHGAGRRRATIHGRRTAAGYVAGFTEARGHAVVDLAACPLFIPALNPALAAARTLAAALKIAPSKPLDVLATATDTGLDLDLRGQGPLPPAALTRLGALAGELDLARISNHGERVIELRPPTVRMGRATVTLPPGAFLQATRAGEETLAGLVTAATEGARRIADLFCGVGTFALRLAERAEVHAADATAPAVAALAQAARHAEGLKRISTETRDLMRRPLVAAELARFDAVVFDPPRAGAAAQAAELARSKVPLVVAVSCNAATLARDLKLLLDGGYRLLGITPVDQFRHAAHVEAVAVLRR